LFSAFVEMDQPRRRIVGEISGLDVLYDLGEGHPLLGRRMPDLEVVTAEGPRRVYSMLHQARPVLLELRGQADPHVSPLADRVQSMSGTYDGVWELPVIGAVPRPTAVLVRPDGHVAWVGEGGARDGLIEALTRWFGPGPV